MNKLMAIDLDGTLLKSDKTMSDDTLRTLMECQKADNLIVFATARAPRDMSMFLPRELMNNPIICYNGACIVKGNQVLYKKELFKEDVTDILDIAKRFNQEYVCVEINNKLYSTFNVVKHLGDVPFQIEDLYNLDFESAYKILICSDGRIPNELLDSLPKVCKGYITDNGVLCQIMNSNVSKWNAIQYLLMTLNISPSDVISFGDDYNDMEMIQKSKIGVAMGNAIDELKSIAKYVTCSNNNDGVAKFLEKYKHLYMSSMDICNEEGERERI